MTYKNAGVDIDKADELIKNAKKLIATTRLPGSIDSIGGFGGIFDPKSKNIKDPLLVAGTDGVGTKLKVAWIAGKHDTIGIDLVAMCVNDVLCVGAKPLFFLDYFACGKLDKKIWSDVVKGIVKGCRETGCALLGGETAEMPGMYKKGEYDLAGFSVGVVDKKKVIDGKKIKTGDVLLGLASTGPHSNGYSLIRKMFSAKKIKEHHKLFLKPTALYVKPFHALMEKVEIKGAAHITGGGFYDNIPRMMPKNKKAVIQKGSWSVPKVFQIIRAEKKIEERELYRTFNMGIGMVLALSSKDAEKAKKILEAKFKLKSWVIGEIKKGKHQVEIE
ncbi:MAG: phosphoribosylformylglycinamidine cyclo-ligase [Candidatus Omnitrophica bacterium]|nr:phosphoribosylformylglycinamidine cyclo-ligase [Candidatus Omnitrophota bacterium]